MLKFDKVWSDEIAEISTSPEYQTARIRIIDPSLIVREYDVDTAQWTITGDGQVYPLPGTEEVGQARIIGVRWGVFSGGESQANAKTVSAIRIQIPQHAVGRVKKSCKVFVDVAPHNPVLVNYMFSVTSDMQGSSAASRTFECALDGDYQAATP